MAKDKDENGDGGKTENVDTNVLIAQALQMLAANQPKRVLDESSPEYQDRLRAEGHYDKFDRPVYQNGIEASPRGLSAETRRRASNLKAGSYCDGKVEVRVGNSGEVAISYSAKGDKPAAFYNRYWMKPGDPDPKFEYLIDRIWDEMHATAPA